MIGTFKPEVGRPSATEIVDIIDVAAEHLERNPWGQGTDRYREGAICAEDAVWMAVFSLGTVQEYLDLKPTSFTMVGPRSLGLAACTAVRRHVRGDVAWADYLWHWNDASGRTKQEVVDAFKETAKELRNRAVPSVIF